MEPLAFALKEDCEVCYVEDELTSSDLSKIKSYLSKFPKNKQIYCRFWIRALCFFPPHICPHAHGFADLKYTEPVLRDPSETSFFHVNTEKPLRLETYAQKKMPLYVLMPRFQDEIASKGLISTEMLVKSQWEFDNDFEKRYKIRGIYQKMEGLRFLRLLAEVSMKRGFFMTRRWVEDEFRRVKLNKLNVKLPEIVSSSHEFLLIGALLPPKSTEPTEIVIFKDRLGDFHEIKIEKVKIFHLKNAFSAEERTAVMNEYSGYVPLNKDILCDVWFRGYCEFDDKTCRNAHGVWNLGPGAFDPQAEPAPAPKIKLKLKIETRNYRHYFEYQENLLKKGLINEKFTLKEININNEKKMFLRKLVQKDQAIEFIHRLFELFGRKQGYIQKSLCERMLKKIGFAKMPYDVYNSDAFYEVKATFIENEKKIKALVVREACSEDLEAETEKRIRETIEVLSKSKSSITLTVINNAYYKRLKPMDPPLTYFLRRRDLSLIEYLQSLQDKGLIKLPANFNFEGEAKIKEKMISQEIQRFWTENSAKQGVCRLKRVRSEIEKKFFENGPLGKFELEKAIIKSGNLIVSLHLGLFVFEPSLFFKKTDIEEEEIPNNPRKKCTSGNNRELKALDFAGIEPIELGERITVIDNIKSLAAAALFLRVKSVFSLDLEGDFNEEGSIELVQIATAGKIFIFDMVSIGNKGLLFEGASYLLKEILESPFKLKLFFDCQKDSFALHYFLGIHCENVVDLSAGLLITEGLIGFVANRKLAQNGSFSEYQAKPVKLPNLNDLLEKFEAKHGVNPLKSEMKIRFLNEPREYFQKRPINPDILEYAAKDVEDLEDVWLKMRKRVCEILKEIEIETDEDGVKEALERVSRKYVKQGCEI